jgi:hypothetical protein
MATSPFSSETPDNGDSGPSVKFNKIQSHILVPHHDDELFGYCLAMRLKNIPHTAWISIRDGVPTLAWRTSFLPRIDVTLALVNQAYTWAKYTLHRSIPSDADFLLFSDDDPYLHDLKSNEHPVVTYGTKEACTMHSLPCMDLTCIFGSTHNLQQWRDLWTTAHDTPFADRHSVLFWRGGATPYRCHIVALCSTIPFHQISPNTSKHAPHNRFSSWSTSCGSRCGRCRLGAQWK